MAAFQRDVAIAARASSRGAAAALNSRAYSIARKAQLYTRVANRSKIEALGLKTTDEKEYTTSRGRKRIARKFALERDEAVVNYIRALAANGVAVAKVSKNLSGIIKRRGGSTRVSKGKKIYFANRGELAARARKWIAKKLRSIGFLKSLWNPTLRRLDRYAIEKGRFTDFKGRHHNVEPFVVPARGNENPSVQFGFRVGPDKYGNSIEESQRNSLNIALRRAIGAEWQELGKHLAKKSKEELRQAGAVVR